MIPRYSRPEMTAVWSPEVRFRIWFEIEAHVCDALAKIGAIPKEAAKAIRRMLAPGPEICRVGRQRLRWRAATRKRAAAGPETRIGHDPVRAAPAGRLHGLRRQGRGLRLRQGR